MHKCSGESVRSSGRRALAESKREQVQVSEREKEREGGGREGEGRIVVTLQATHRFSLHSILRGESNAMQERVTSIHMYTHVDRRVREAQKHVYYQLPSYRLRRNERLIIDTVFVF